MTPSERLSTAAPDEAREMWFCQKGDFWGTPNQLVLCARCGVCEPKRHDEPRHFADVCKPTLHLFCDECWDALPNEYIHPYHRPAIAKSQESA